MSENNSLRSKYLNRVIKEMDVKPNTPSALIDELCVANGLPYFLYRISDKKYIRLIEDQVYINYLSPVMQRVKDELVDGGRLVINYNPIESIRALEEDNKNKDLLFEMPLMVNKKEEKEFINNFRSEDLVHEFQEMYSILDSIPNVDKNYRNYCLSSKELAQSDYVILMKTLYNLKKNGYRGEYPEINDLFKDLLVANIDGNEATPMCIQDLMYLWSYIITTAIIATWMDYRKIYRIADPIAKDFIRMEEIRISKQALSYIPCRTFAIDVSANSDLSGYFDCIFVSIVEYEGDYRIYYEIFDNNGIHATSKMLRSLYLGEGQDEISINAESLKKIYTKDFVDDCNLFKNRQQMRISRIDRSKMHPSDELFCKYQPTPPSAFRKAEKMVIGTIFYLCCANKSTKKMAVKSSRSSNYDAKNKDTHPIEIEDLGVREEQELEAEFQQAIINYNEIVNMGSHSETHHASGSSTKKRKSPRPHMVNGHQSHVWRGKGENKVRVPIYIRPYWTGAKNNRIVTVTTLK